MDAFDGFFTDEAESSASPTQVRPVENPRRPADAGLSILGVLMRVGGLTFALIGGCIALASLPAPNLPLTVTLAALLSVARSAVQSMAGGALIDQGPAGVSAINTYAMVAGLHTALCMVLLMVAFDPPVSIVIAASLVLMAWPLLLMVLIRRPDSRAAIAAAAESDHRLLPEDRGLTALGVLMVLGGVLALAVSLAMIVSGLLGGVVELGFLSMLFLAATGLFVVRAYFGLQAGRVAISTRDPYRLHEALGRYRTLANASLAALVVLTLLTALISGGGGGLIAFLLVAPALLATHAWPSTVMRYAERNLPEGTFSDERLPSIRRPRDAGLTGLGVVLLATGLPTLVVTVSAYTLVSTYALAAGELPAMLQAAVATDPRGPISALAAFVAGWSLWHMTPRFQLAAVVYGVVGGGLALWGGYEQLMVLWDPLEYAGPQLIVLGVLQVTLGLALPGAVTWLALRHEEVGRDDAEADLASAFD